MFIFYFFKSYFYKLNTRLNKQFRFFFYLAYYKLNLIKIMSEILFLMMTKTKNTNNSGVFSSSHVKWGQLTSHRYISSWKWNNRVSFFHLLIRWKLPSSCQRHFSSLCFKRHFSSGSIRAHFPKSNEYIK